MEPRVCNILWVFAEGRMKSLESPMGNRSPFIIISPDSEEKKPQRWSVKCVFLSKGTQVASSCQVLSLILLLTICETH